MKQLINVTGVQALDATRLRLSFSDGQHGIMDLSDILAEGGSMVEPLRRADFFRRVFVQCGVPTWPNGFDLDAIRLHADMEAAGLLEPNTSATRNAAE